MTSGEIAQWPGVSGPTVARPSADDTHELGDQVVELARALPGDLRRLTVRSGDRAIEVEWASDADPADGHPHTVERAGAGRPETAPDGSGPVPEVPEGLSAVRAPLVGTFYAAPVPGAEPFVRVGGEVEAGQTLGLIEAMKLMNPICAEVPGVVAELRVGDADSVEYDQVLMLLRPDGQPR